MDNLGPRVGIDQRQTPGNDVVQRTRPLAAAEDEQTNRPLAIGETRCRRRQPRHFRTQRIANPDAFREDIGKTAGHPVGDSREHAVGQAGNRILLMDEQWATEQRCHHAAREAHVATHAEDDIRADPADFPPRLPACREQVKG
jgi:hypothetical protein